MTRANEKTVYNEAANKAKELGEKTAFQSTKAQCEDFYNTFLRKFSPEALQAVEDSDLPWYMFASRDPDVKDYMTWWLEFQGFSKNFLGVISGASSFVYPLHMGSHDRVWKTGTVAKPIDVDEDEAIRIAVSVRERLTKAVEIIYNTAPGSVESYREMSVKIKGALGDMADRMWVQKYCQLIFPSYFATFFSERFQRHVLYFFGIVPEDDPYVRSGQISLIQRNSGLFHSEFGEMFAAATSKLSSMPRFIRVGTSLGGVDYFRQWLDTGTAHIGWNELGSLDDYVENGRIEKKKLNNAMFDKYYQDKKRSIASKKATEPRLFYESNSKGDMHTIFVAMNGHKLLALGDNIGKYEYRKNESFAHTIPVEWHVCFDEGENLPNNDEYLQTTCKEFEDPENLIFLYHKFFNEIDHQGNVAISEAENELTGECMKADIGRDKPQYEIEDEDDFGGYERNRIIFGAPGTGKSFLLNEDRKSLLKGCEENYERVTFYPDYSYAQFVGTYKPAMDEDGKSIIYSYIPGPFLRILVKALRSGMTREPEPYLLLLEEINRAKMASVFGDIFQLLDRNDNGSSAYEISTGQEMRKYLLSELGGKESDYEHIRIPNNMFIWATMNSADQGVFPMDTAFKRRWSFEYIGIDDKDQNVHGIFRAGSGKNAMDVDWNDLRKAINDKLAEELKINEDKLLGPYFIESKYLKCGDDGRIEQDEEFLRVFKSKVLMYLFEDAARQYRTRLFDCEGNTRYSSICAQFDDKGVSIFGADVAEKLKGKAEDEGITGSI